MEVTDEAVIWHRLGTDTSPHQGPSVVGLEVVWYNSLGLYVFGKEEFERTIVALIGENRE
ncbi:MAG: hypothetical protein KDC35_11285 [Acidobacteria bacterium]|nr:hypothetical protein [Acidobacteriota bacterium]